MLEGPVAKWSYGFLLRPEDEFDSSNSLHILTTTTTTQKKKKEGEEEEDRRRRRRRKEEKEKKKKRGGWRHCNFHFNASIILAIKAQIEVCSHSSVNPVKVK